MDEIYGLYHPETGELRYIGKAKNSAKRLRSHMRDARRRKTPVYSWIRSLDAWPEIRLLMVTWDWPASERALIAQYAADGARLLNLSPGGDQPVCPPEIRARNGRLLAGRIRDDESFRRLCYAKRRLGFELRQARPLLPQTLDKMRYLAFLAPKLFGDWANV